MRRMKKLRESEARLFFFQASPPPPPRRLPPPFPATSHPWFSLFGVNIPNVSLFVYCTSAVTEGSSRLCDACNKTDHIARLEREKFNLNTFILLCLSQSFSQRFRFKLYNVKKKNEIGITNYCHTLLTPFRGRVKAVCKRLD